MSVYAKTVTASASTTRSAPATGYIKVATGILHRFEISFPSGCAGLVHASLWIGGHQIIPLGAGTTFTGDDVEIEFNEYLVIEQGANEIRIEVWNEDNTFSHTVEVRIGVLPEDVLAFGTLMSRVPDLVRKILLGRQKKSEKGET